MKDVFRFYSGKVVLVYRVHDMLKMWALFSLLCYTLVQGVV